jgi:hypothetical protein
MFQRCLLPPSSGRWPSVPAKLLPCPTCSYILTHFFACGLLISLMMDEVSFSETLVNFYQTVRRNNQKRQPSSYTPPWEPKISLSFMPFIFSDFLNVLNTSEVN